MSMTLTKQVLAARKPLHIRRLGVIAGCLVVGVLSSGLLLGGVLGVSKLVATFVTLDARAPNISLPSREHLDIPSTCTVKDAYYGMGEWECGSEFIYNSFLTVSNSGNIIMGDDSSNTITINGRLVLNGVDVTERLK